MFRAGLLTMCVAALVACESKEAGNRALKQLDDLQKKKAADAEAKKAKENAPPLQAEAVKLDAPYNDEGSDKIVPDAPCPEGMWSLFATEAPGATPEEKKTNEANRKTLAEGIRGKQFMVKLRVGSGVMLRPYDAAKGEVIVEVAGTIDCTDSRGRVAIAWSEPKATARGQAGDFAQTYWDAAPVTFTLPMTSMTDAKAFEKDNKVAVSARVVFKPGKVEIDKRIKKVEKLHETAGAETVGYGGGMEDWGAGRLLRAELVGIRVAVDREKRQLFDQRGAKR